MPGTHEAKRVGEHENAHDGSGDRQDVHAGSGDVLRPLGQRVQLLRRQVDDSLHGGVAQLGENHQPDANHDEGPADELKVGQKTRDDRQDARDEHDLDVSLRLNGRDKPLDRVAKRADEGRMILV